MQEYYIGGLRMPAKPDLPTSSHAHSSHEEIKKQQAHSQELGVRFASVQAAKEGDTETLRRTLFKLPVRCGLCVREKQSTD